MEFKGTKGDIKYDESLGEEDSGIYQTPIGFKGNLVAFTYSNDYKEVIENTKLIEDAFKVRQEIDCNLTELLEQRNELLETLQKAIKRQGFTNQELIEARELIKRILE